ncbi:MAG: carbohydrate kinase family protein [Chloroflexota bacterium]|nr:carbohydrate kinase family protein [Chloroflexota bacterium]
MFDVLVAGHLCVDIIPEIPPASARSDSFLAPGHLTEVGAAVISTGGAVSNTGLALHRLGLDVRLVARIGDDHIGQLPYRILEARSEKLVQDLAIAQGEGGSYTLVINPPGVDRTFLHYPGPNDTFGPDDIPVPLLDTTRLFHFGYPPAMRRMYVDGGRALATIFRDAKEHGTTTSLDMAMPDPSRPSGRADWRSILARTLPYVDIFAPSVEELFYMLHKNEYNEMVNSIGQDGLIEALAPGRIASLAQEALSLGAAIVMLKLGHRGLYMRSGKIEDDLGRGTPTSLKNWRERELWAPCFKVEVAGTVGAGDTTIAGFLGGLLRGQTPEGAATSAVAVGACNVETADATSGVRPWDVTQARIQAGWPRLEAHVDAPGWDWDTEKGIWRGPHDH